MRNLKMLKNINQKLNGLKELGKDISQREEKIKEGQQVQILKNYKKYQIKLTLFLKKLIYIKQFQKY